MLISGANIPALAIEMKKGESESGCEKLEVMMIQGLNTILADCDEVLAYNRKWDI